MHLRLGTTEFSHHICAWPPTTFGMLESEQLSERFQQQEKDDAGNKNCSSQSKCKAFNSLCWNVKRPQACCLNSAPSPSRYCLAFASKCVCYFYPGHQMKWGLDASCVREKYVYCTSALSYTMSRVRTSNYRRGWRCVCDISQIISYLYLYSSDDKHWQDKQAQNAAFFFFFF